MDSTFESEVRVSVVVATYQREAVLCETIDQLLGQSYPSYEIIVVDQSKRHEPSTMAYLASVADRIRYLRVQTPNLPAARNIGLREATGEIIVFVDDDVIIGTDFLRRHVKNYADRDVVGVAGRVVEAPWPPLNELSPAYLRHRERSLGWLSINYDHFTRMEVEQARGCNMSFRSAALLAVGGFDENYVGNAVREEADVCYQLRYAGHRIVFDPDAELVHLLMPSGGCRQSGSSRLGYYRYLATHIRNDVYFMLKNTPSSTYLEALRWQYDQWIRTDVRLARPARWPHFLVRNVSFLHGLAAGVLAYLRWVANTRRLKTYSGAEPHTPSTVVGSW